MAKQIDPIKKERYKRARMEGKAKSRALLEAGYSKATALHHQDELGVVKCVEAEIREEFKKEDITEEYVLKNLKKLAETSILKSDQIRANELLGKYLAMFTDKFESKVISSEKQDLLTKLAQSLLLNKENIINIPQPVVGDVENN